MTTATPRTAAGKALVRIAVDQSIHLGHLPEPLDRIVARIEAEAAAALLAALRALGNDLTPGGWHVVSCDLAEPHWPACEQARALLRDLSPEEEGQ